MRVTVVTVSFDQAPFLERAIGSVLAQTHNDVEYVVVDAGSSDGSREIIERYAARISRTILEPDEGPADGLNKGFSSSSGEIGICVNADDVLLPRAAAEAVAAFEADPSADVVYGDGYVIDECDRILRVVKSDRFTPQRYVYARSTVLQQATFFRLNAFRRVGGFNVENRTSWDGELLLDIALGGGSLKHVDGLWGAFRLHPTSISGAGTNGSAYRRDYERMFKRVVGRRYRRRDGLLVAAGRIAKWGTKRSGQARKLGRWHSRLRPPHELTRDAHV